MQFWERDEVSSFLSFANDKYSRDESMRWVYIVYLLALNTGLRAGEIWGLKVKDVSFDRGTIVIERQLLSKERVVAPTKGKNIRKVPCNHLLKDELLSLIENKQLTSGSFLFQSSNNRPIYHSNFRNRFFQLDLRDSGVKCIRFHDLRHTALTLMVESKINLKVVQSIAGHSDIQTTMRYVHLLASNIEEVSEIFILS
jgi:integrase